MKTNFEQLKPTFALLILLLAVISPGIKAQSVIVSGNWSLNVPMIDITEAGNNYSGNYTSNPDQVLISHSFGWFFSRYRWTVDVHKEDVAWNSNLIIWTRRTGNGSGFWCFASANITGGEPYQQITNNTVRFFQGTCSRSSVPIQFQLRNVSVLTPADNYSTTIVYTITFTSY